MLESGFSSDTGKGSDDGLFNRESTIYVSGPYGTVYAGRMGTLFSDAGSVGFYGAMASPFGSGWGDILGHEEVFSKADTRYNNTLSYVSPRFAGFQVYAQYAMGEDNKENKPSSDRYAALGLDYQVGNLEVGFLVDYLNKDSSKLPAGTKIHDAYTVNLAANYDFGVLKAFAAVQYMKDTRKMGKWFIRKDGVELPLEHEGFGVNLGVDVPLWGGNFMVSTGYADADADTYSGSKYADAKAFYGLAGYSYPFSKRTSVYAAAGYSQAKHEGVDSSTSKTTEFQAMAGLVHKF